MALGITWTPHIRMSFGGHLGSQAEESWSNTIRWKTVEPQRPTSLVLQQAADALEVPIAAWLRSADSKIHGSAFLDFIKLNWIQADGTQADPNTILHEVVGVNGGGGLASGPPFYQTFAITMRTRIHRGRSHAGRIFPPVVVHQSAGNGSPYQDAASAGAQAAAFITMLRGARTAIGTALQTQGLTVPDPAIFSPGNQEKGTLPLWSSVISAVVDRVPDVQHRRTKSIPRAEGAETLLDP